MLAPKSILDEFIQIEENGESEEEEEYEEGEVEQEEGEQPQEEEKKVIQMVRSAKKSEHVSAEIPCPQLLTICFTARNCS